jgi:mannose-6-phosphate isomerase-like protein (cupin superfamily)
MVKKVNIADKLNQFDDHWNPRIIGELNGQHIKVAKLKGEFFMHNHKEEDEMFLIIKGQLKMLLEDQAITLGPGEFVIIPKGVDHNPIAEEEVELMLFEPKTTVNTGNIQNERTQQDLDTL